MARTRRTAVRVAVGTDFGPRSAVWRIWTSGDEVYVSPRSLASTMKTSLHSSGLFRHAFTDEAKSAWIPDGDRAWFKWDEPAEFADGARLLLEIVVPTNDLTVPSTEPPAEDKTKIRLIDPAPPPSGQVASWAMPTRGTLWVVASHHAPSDPQARRIEEGRALSGDAPVPASAIHPRKYVWLHDPESRVSRCLDLAARGPASPTPPAADADE